VHLFLWCPCERVLSTTIYMTMSIADDTCLLLVCAYIAGMTRVFKSFQCAATRCYQRFYSEEDLEQHLMDAEHFECVYCCERFAIASFWKEHETQVHQAPEDSFLSRFQVRLSAYSGDRKHDFASVKPEINPSASANKDADV